jgi:hypothetical protein
MNAQETHGAPRDTRFLDTVALGSMLVFASVMPPLDPDEGARGAADDAADENLTDFEAFCRRNPECRA